MLDFQEQILHNLDIQMNTVTVEQLKSDPNLRAAWADKLVYIYSNVHQDYRRDIGEGYRSTRRIGEAGIFDFSEAWNEANRYNFREDLEFEEIKS